MSSDSRSNRQANRTSTIEPVPVAFNSVRERSWRRCWSEAGRHFGVVGYVRPAPLPATSNISTGEYSDAGDLVCVVQTGRVGHAHSTRGDLHDERRGVGQRPGNLTEVSSAGRGPQSSGLPGNRHVADLSTAKTDEPVGLRAAVLRVGVAERCVKHQSACRAELREIYRRSLRPGVPLFRAPAVIGNDG